MKQPLIKPSRQYGTHGKWGFRLQEDYDFRDFVVKKDYWWDGSSSPRIVWTTSGITPGSPWALLPSMYHDYVLEHGGDIGHTFIPRQQAHKNFRDMLLENGVSKFKAYKAYVGVSMFGKGAY